MIDETALVPSIKVAILSRIERRLEKCGLTPAGASLAAGLGPDLIRDWVRKPKTMPTVPSIVALAPILETRPEWLAFGTGDEEVTSENIPSDVTPVPLVSWIAASQMSPIADPMPATEIVYCDRLPHHKFIALKIIGDSMNLVAPTGAKIIVDLDDKHLVPKKFYIFTNGIEATFKRYMVNPTRIEPFSTNTNYEPIELSDEVNVVGRVIRSIYEL